jgi:pimeloyl-ACP methyl ester carboxylesterase
MVRRAWCDTGEVTSEFDLVTGRRQRTRRAVATGGALLSVVLLVAACSSGSSTSTASKPSSSTQPLKVTWMPGSDAPGTPAKYNRVGVIKVGPDSAKNVLVLEPGTSAGSAYFVPLARWLVAKAPGWQVWSVERRENLLEDQSVLNAYKQGKASSTQLYDYYLGYIKDSSITHHIQMVPASSVEFAKQWGMRVAVEDLRRVITAARHLGGKVVLGGHSLGGAVVTAYATWDFGGHAGADDLAGLVYIDGSSQPTPVSATQATQALQVLQASATPWLAFGGIAAPYAGIFSATGGVAAVRDPDGPSLGQSSGLLPQDIVPPVRVTNAGQFGYALNASTSPPSLLAAQAHLGQGLSPQEPVHGWDGTGALTPLSRFATMLSGYGIQNVDGSEWYFPQRLTDDTGAVANGNANPAQQVLDVDATMGHHLPKDLLIYAFGAKLGGAQVPADTELLAEQSGIPRGNLTLVDRQSTYSHNDPAGAYPANAFFDDLVPFLAKVSGQP